MYRYITTLLNIAIESYSSNAKYKELAEEYKLLLDRVTANDISTEDLNEIKYLYMNRYKQETFTSIDRYQINKELAELEKHTKGKYLN